MCISTSTSALEKRFGIEGFIKKISDNNILFIDYGLDTGAFSLEDVKSSRNYAMDFDDIKKFYKEIRTIADNYGVKTQQTHAMYGSLDPLCVPEYREIHKKNILAASLLGSHYIVIHPITNAQNKEHADLQENLDASRKYFKELKPFLQDCGVKIGLENIPRGLPEGGCVADTFSNPDDILEMLDILGTDCFCVCPDIGHMALTEHETHVSPTDFINKVGKYVEIVHVQEVNTEKTKDMHTVPYTNEVSPVDWDEILKAFADIKYQGTWNFEIGNNYYNLYDPDDIDSALKHLKEVGDKMVSKIAQY